MDRHNRTRLSLYVAEWQKITRNLLADLEGDEDVDEVIRALWECEAAARRWHMKEAIESGRIKMPAIEEFDDAAADVFDD